MTHCHSPKYNIDLFVASITLFNFFFVLLPHSHPCDKVRLTDCYCIDASVLLCSAECVLVCLVGGLSLVPIHRTRAGKATLTQPPWVRRVDLGENSIFFHFLVIFGCYVRRNPLSSTTTREIKRGGKSQG